MRKIKCSYNPDCQNEDLEICNLCKSATEAVCEFEDDVITVPSILQLYVDHECSTDCPYCKDKTISWFVERMF